MLQNHSITYSSFGEQFLPKLNITSSKFQAFHICYFYCVEFGQVLLTPVERFTMLPRSRSRTHHIHMLLLHWEYTKTCFHSNPPKNSAPTLGVDKKCMFGKYSMSKKIIISLNMWYRRRNMGYAESLKEKKYEHMKVEVKK